MMIPRLVAFGPDGKAICAGNAAHIAKLEGARTEVFSLPSEHYDFIDVDVRGMTAEQIGCIANEPGLQTVPAMTVVEIMIALCNHADNDDIAGAVINAAVRAGMIDNVQAGDIARIVELDWRG